MPERKSARVLVVDDDESVREALASALEDAGYETLAAESLAAAREAVGRERPALVLLDVRLRDGSGLDLLAELRGSHPDLPVIMATAYGDGDRTIAAMKGGAFDYVTKPFELPLLLASVGRAARAARPAPRVPSPPSTSTFLGSSPAMLPVWKAIGRAAASDVPVLVTGESGVGKELTARAIHEHGERRAEPFVAVNVAALPAGLVESELFGHERGAFTGANGRRLGRFELARGGTIFLDEIGDLDPALQTKLLRVLEGGTFERVGGETAIASGARVIAATSRPVRPGSGGTLREDLFYRLSVVNIRVPPLRERRGDIPLLVDAFLQRRGGPRRAISEPAMDLLTELEWPGNVRQLLHVVENACVMSAADVLDVGDFDLGLATEPAEEAPAGPTEAAAVEPEGDADGPRTEDLDLRTNLERLERSLIAKAMAKTGGNRARAARLLGIRRQHLYTRLEALGIEDERRSS